jgi:tape measure domain-containing protein
VATEEIGVRLSVKGRREAARALRDTADDVKKIGDASDGASRGMRRASLAGDRLGSSLGRGLAGSARLSNRALSGLASTAIGLGWRLGAAATAAGAAAIAIGIKTAAGMEQAEIGFTTMLGSGEKARAFLDDLKDFAAKTPFDLPGLQQSASSLISAGVEASKVIPIMKSLGDVTSGMGTGAEGIARATVALQQMNAAGKITGEDLNQLRDAGIPVYDLLSAAVGKSKAEVVELAQKGKLGGDALKAMMNALETGKGLERFTGLMEKQSASLTGLWSTLKDTFEVGMAEAVQPMIPMLKNGLTGAITIAGDATRRLGQRASVLAQQFADGEGAGGRLRQRLEDLKADAVKLWNEFRAGVGTGGDLRDALETMGTAALVVGGIARDVLVPALAWFADHPDALKGIVAGMAALRVATWGAAAAQGALNVAQAAGFGGKAGAAGAAGKAASAGVWASRGAKAAKVAKVGGPVAIGAGALATLYGPDPKRNSQADAAMGGLPSAPLTDPAMNLFPSARQPIEVTVRTENNEILGRAATDGIYSRDARR